MDATLWLTLVASALVGTGIGTGFAAQLRWPPSRMALSALVGAISAAIFGVGIAYLGREANAQLYAPAVAEVCKIVRPEALTDYGVKACK